MSKFNILFSLLLFISTIDASFSLGRSNKIIPQREHSIVFYNGSYVPGHLSIFEGENLVVHFGNFSGSPACLWSKKLDFFVSSYQGKLTSSILKNLETGTYEFTCPTIESDRPSTFTLTVQPRPKLEDKKEADRLPASVGLNSNEWFPRDERQGVLPSVIKQIENTTLDQSSNLSDYPDSNYDEYFKGDF
ncbi:MAG: hypothetical protein CME61_03475 [Halobacteriovoraceae bacterium]|nr:hypothetical protein [Halobacteriovoraceae bacterium]